MTSQERVIDGYLELLKQSRLDAETSLENMEKVVTYFQVALFGTVARGSLVVAHSVLWVRHAFDFYLVLYVERQWYIQGLQPGLRR